MSRRVEVQLQPAVLRWARERSHLEPNELTRKIPVKVERVQAWEETGRISLAQIGKLAAKVKIPNACDQFGVQRADTFWMLRQLEVKFAWEVPGPGTVACHRWRGSEVGTAASHDEQLDFWADWLLHGRQRNAPEVHRRRQSEYLARVTDRVLRGAEIKVGDHVLDVGAGTGQLALEALPRVRPDGRVVAIDLSRDSLKGFVRTAGRGVTADVQLSVVQADAAALPFAGASFDAVTTRSVLMYIADRARAIREMERVLRPGGRVSLYEAVDSHWVAPNIRSGDSALAPIAADHERVIAHMESRSTFSSEILGFTEGQLMNDVANAGFTSIDMTFEHHVDEAYRGSAWEARTFVVTQPHPGTPSYEEAAHEVLGMTAETHLRRFEELLVERPFRLAWAVAYVTAQKPGE